MMTWEGSTKVVNFMIPEAGVIVLRRCHLSHVVKMPYFIKNLLLYTQSWIRQTKYKVMMIKEECTKNFNFHDPRARGSCAGA